MIQKNTGKRNQGKSHFGIEKLSKVGFPQKSYVMLRNFNLIYLYNRLYVTIIAQITL